ncbi:MAG TPA: cytidine deaminase [Bacillota bacterium]|nr:cytidine deaminase [Bacillota bacterium]
MKELYLRAKEAREKAYAPYSTFKVGAAVLTANNHIYSGCNIENAAYPSSCCAERVALFQAIAHGETHFQAIMIVADTKRPVPPCGACRQVMSEFFTEHTAIHMATLEGEIKTMTMNDILPLSFQKGDLHSH